MSSSITSLPKSEHAEKNLSEPTQDGETLGSPNVDPIPRHANEICEGDHNEAAAGLRGSNAVCLTWQELWVRVPSGRNGYRPILQGLIGYARPGKVLAIMGPSGCGKSTLLDALAGRLDPKVKKTGKVLINGRQQPLAYGTSAYVTQEDVLTWTLTIKEALHYSAQLLLPHSMPITVKKLRVEATIKEMGLQDVINTRIGKSSKKGLSNGQKRRLSICMEILTRPRLLFLDEPTSGLDSAASCYVMRRIVNLALKEGMTVVAAIHQPGSQVFELFHDLCLLSSGKNVYFGPREQANEFFAVNGFPCPSLQNPSDHFLNIINTDFLEDIELGYNSKIINEKAVEVLAKSYNLSDIYKQTKRQIAEILEQGGESLQKRSSVSFFRQCLILTKRSFVNMHRDIGYYWVRLAVHIALSFGLGTIFYNIGSSHNSIQARGSMLMYVASFITMMAIGGFPSFVEEMKVFRRERLNGHYSTGAFVISNALSSMPYLVTISIIPGAIAYYLVGLQQGYEHFIYFSLVLFASMMLVETLMMIVASILPDFFMGLIAGAGIQGLMMLSGGFFQLPNELPLIIWKYPLYYIAFHRYAYQGLYKNEYEGLTFPDKRSHVMTGEEVLREFWQVAVGYSKWVDLVVLFGMVICYRILLLGALRMSEKFR